MRIDPAAVRWSVPERDRAAELSRRGLVVLLHGRYSDETDPVLDQSAFPAVVASLRGPVRLSDKFSWFLSPDGLPAPEAGLARITDAIAAWLDDIGVRRAAFVGFSQGGATVLEFAVRHPERATAAVAVAGFAASAAPPDDRVPPPLLWLRGEADDVVADLEPALRGWLPASATVRSYPGVGHTVTREQLADAVAWLRGGLLGTRQEER